MKAVRENAGVPRFKGQQIGLVLGWLLHENS